MMFLSFGKLPTKFSVASSVAEMTIFFFYNVQIRMLAQLCVSPNTKERDLEKFRERKE